MSANPERDAWIEKAKMAIGSADATLGSITQVVNAEAANLGRAMTAQETSDLVGGTMMMVQCMALIGSACAAIAAAMPTTTLEVVHGSPVRFTPRLE